MNEAEAIRAMETDLNPRGDVLIGGFGQMAVGDLIHGALHRNSIGREDQNNRRARQEGREEKGRQERAQEEAQQGSPGHRAAPYALR